MITAILFGFGMLATGLSIGLIFGIAIGERNAPLITAPVVSAESLNQTPDSFFVPADADPKEFSAELLEEIDCEMFVDECLQIERAETVAALQSKFAGMPFGG